MKKNRLITVLAAASFAAPGILSAQISIPSDGSDGALNVTSANLQIDLSQAVTGTWSENNAANAGKGVWDPDKRAIVFKYTSVNIASGRTVTFKNHPNRPPVVWLVQGDVTIAGTVSMNGSTPSGSFLLAEPGPGGFRGGAATGGAGLGFGGSNGRNGFPDLAASFASVYGNPQILPLIGGSGSGATNYSNYPSGGGGGAILIAAGTTVTLNGSIAANGARNASDGAVRIVANTIGGSGTIDLRDDGRIRFEANSVFGNLITFPQTVAVAPASPPQIWPSDDAPKCRIIQVDTQATPANPNAPVDLVADVGLDANAGQVVTIQTTKFPVTGTVQLRAAGKFANNANLITATFQAGDFEQATWTATVPFANGFTVLQARAFIPAQAP